MYQRTYWVDHVVSPQSIYSVKDNGDGTQTITPAGEVIQEGTPIDQAHLNHMEDGIWEAHRLIETLTETVDEGVNSVYTTNGNSFDDEGLKIAPEDGGMATKIDGDGISVQQRETGQESFSVKEAEATARNFAVTDSVTLGGKLRIEQCDESEIGLYWIGG